MQTETFKQFQFLLSRKNKNDSYKMIETKEMKMFEKASSIISSLSFICVITLFCACWIGFNEVFLSFDAYPFAVLQYILLLLLLITSCVTCASTVHLHKRLRIAYEQEYHENKKFEHDLRQIADHLSYQDIILKDVLERVTFTQERTQSQKHTTEKTHTRHMKSVKLVKQDDE